LTYAVLRLFEWALWVLETDNWVPMMELEKGQATVIF
jgi:hypothetical protein